MTITTPIPTELSLAAIDPKMGGRYSPNLHAHLRRNQVALRFGRVYSDAAGTLWLGHVSDGSFTGARLNHILSFGAKAQRADYPGMHRELTEVAGFWGAYRRIGRCAIDTDHTTHFIGDDGRWSHIGETRSCSWCGNVTQRLRRWTEIVEVKREVWEPFGPNESALS